MLRAIALAVLVPVALLATPGAVAAQPSCVVERVIDGDTFVCEGGLHVRLLQINAPELGACGGEWAGSALRNIFLRPGTHARLDYDGVTADRYGRDLAAPIVTGGDGAEYNISVVMVYVGLANWAYYGDNAKYLALAKAAQDWAKTAQWNMWAPGGPFNGATNCG